MPKITAKSLGISKQEILRDLTVKLEHNLPFLNKLSTEELNLRLLNSIRTR